MRILIVCKANFEPSEINFQKNRAYIYDQVQKLREQGVLVEVFFLSGKGILSYLNGAIRLSTFLKKNRYDIVHGHYGFTGVIVGLVCKYPVVVTYHGSDLNVKYSKVISRFSIWMADWNIFVSEKLYRNSIFMPKKRFSIIPCGVDLDVFYPIDQSEAIRKLNWNNLGKKILFSSSFSNAIKNVSLAKTALEKVGRNDLEFIELSGKSREEVAMMLNGCDVLLLTSYCEGSPQIIKEAMACNCPLVATDVGDIKLVIGQAENCYTTDFEANEIALKIELIINNGKRSNGREYIENYNNNLIVKKILAVYEQINLT